MTSRTPQGPLEKASKTPRRSRTTNDPIKARHKATTSRGLRVRDLFRSFMTRLDPSDVVAQAAALRAAELTATAEDIRERITAGDFELAEQLVRVENLVDRAERRLARIDDAKAKRPYSIEDIQAAIDAAATSEDEK
jgi:hypothetical protein